MNRDGKQSVERTSVEKATAAILTGRHREKVATRKWREKHGADRISWQLRTDGGRMILQMAKDMATKVNVKLDAVDWLSDPARQALHQSSDTYTLIANCGDRLERQVFLREDLEQAPANETTRNRLRTILKAFLTGLHS